MRNHGIATRMTAIAAVALVTLVFARLGTSATSALIRTPPHARALAANATNSQQYPVMDMMANHLIQKYQQASCEQLWMERADKNKPKSPKEQEAIGILRNDPEMRAAFISRVAAPIANKMFECGMIP